MANNFLELYTNTIIDCASNSFDDNYDTRRFGPLTTDGFDLKKRMRAFVLNVGTTSGILKSHWIKKGTKFIEPRKQKLEWLYEKLSDDESKLLLVKLLAFRALGQKRVKLPLNNPQYWDKFSSIEQQMDGAESIDLGFNGWRAQKINLECMGYRIELFSRAPAVMTQFELQQYRCQLPDGVIDVEDGDVVFDGGGCYADTALCFACKAGPSGRVYSFEFLPENLAIYRRNLDLNAETAQRIKVIERPLWSKSGEKLFVEGNGPGTRVLPHSTNPQATPINTIAIDELVREEKLEKANFIKMDIEGAELNALQGAAKTIQSFKPKLAITVYHSLEDFWLIPEFISSLDCGYKFYLRHFTIHAEETVLFATT